MNAVIRTQFLRYYRELLKNARQIPNYSYREFAVRRIKEAFFFSS